MDLSRRFFLGGAISLVAAQTFIPSVRAMTNLPTIYGNSLNDDTGGLNALFANEPVLFNKDQIGIESHKGLKFHRGRFVITNTVHIPKNCDIDIAQPHPYVTFIGKDLPPELPFFSCEDFSGHSFAGKVVFEMKPMKNKILIEFKNLHNEKDGSYD